MDSSNNSTASTALQPSLPSDTSGTSESATLHTILFIKERLIFQEEYPSQLLNSHQISPIEFNAIISRLNDDLSVPMRSRFARVKRISKLVFALCIITVGVTLAPLVAIQAIRQKRCSTEFWENVRAYLKRINIQTYYKRGIEWRLVDFSNELENKMDAFNPLLAYKIELHSRPIPSYNNNSANASVANSKDERANGATGDDNSVGNLTIGSDLFSERESSISLLSDTTNSLDKSNLA